MSSIDYKIPIILKIILLTSSNSLVGRDTGHGDGVRGRLVTEARGQGGLATDVRSLHLLDDRAVHDVVDQVLRNASLLEKTPEMRREM